MVKSFLLPVIALATAVPTATAFQAPPSYVTNPTSKSAVVMNSLRDIAAYPDEMKMMEEFERFDRNGAYTNNWRTNQGYSNRGTYRESETNPYYDAGWAQSIRRDNSDFRGRGYGNFDNGVSTYPGVSRNGRRIYTNPTNPYYDPLWSQSHLRNDEPIRGFSYSSRVREYGPYGGYGMGMGGGFEPMYDEFYGPSMGYGMGR